MRHSHRSSFRRSGGMFWGFNRPGYYYYYDPLPEIAEHFREKKAISPESALSMNKLDWISLGLRTKPTETYKFIRKTKDNKYWVDLEKLEEYVSKTTKNQKMLWTFMKYFLIVFGVIFCLIFCGIMVFFAFTLLSGLGLFTGMAAIPFLVQ
ncbi:hypothetical protein JW766_04345 [Candidatus Dojkabacteria bacterium]|nr:hypothetical protein [Candidatus Dojkabacteria bacterium]